MDHIPSVLVDAFKREVRIQHQYTWTDTQQSGDWLLKQKNERWLTLRQKQLVENGNIGEWDPTVLFCVLLYSSLGLFIEEVPGVVIKPKSKHVSSANLAKGNKILIDGDCFFEVDVGEEIHPNLFELSRPAPKKASGKIYKCRPEWFAVDQLRDMRNNKYGHRKIKSGTHITKHDLDMLFRAVEAAYNDLGMPSHRIGELKAIETGVLE